MPEMRSYKVIQTREVEILANTMTDATLIAQAAFENKDNPFVDGKKIWGRATTEIKDLSIHTDRIS